MCEVRETGKRGRGVFAVRDFAPGEVIEVCPVVTFSEKEANDVDKTPFTNYWFGWKDDDPNEYGAIAGGCGLFYNHSNDPAAHHERDYERKAMVMRAARHVKKDEEVTIKYAMVWFPVED